MPHLSVIKLGQLAGYMIILWSIDLVLKYVKSNVDLNLSPGGKSSNFAEVHLALFHFKQVIYQTMIWATCTAAAYHVFTTAANLHIPLISILLTLASAILLATDSHLPLPILFESIFGMIGVLISNRISLNFSEVVCLRFGVYPTELDAIDPCPRKFIIGSWLYLAGGNVVMLVALNWVLVIEESIYSSLVATLTFLFLIEIATTIVACRIIITSQEANIFIYLVLLQTSADYLAKVAKLLQARWISQHIRFTATVFIHLYLRRALITHPSMLSR